ncbi:head GIN domain-containing protein [Hyphococcus sp.]|uniref:head GIN domain-containing protein n=1 Tax=Hyphococcus sp. TaxID=2038636 RepID=UPI003CCB9E96
MKVFFGVIIGLALAIGVAVAAAYYAFGGIGDLGGRDKSNDVMRTIDVTGFDRIDIAGVYEIDVTVGGDYSVQISGAPSEMEKLDASVSNGELVLDQDRSKKTKRSWRNTGLTAVIILPSLSAIDIAGVADATVRGVEGDEFRVDLSGVGDIDVSGTCGRLDADVSGVGELNARALECRDVDVEVSGIGEAKVYASQSVDAAVNGIGSISVYGSPENVDKSSTFLSSISVK